MKTKGRQPTLLDAAQRRGSPGSGAPLADRVRPQKLDDVVGQASLIGERGLLRSLIESDRIPSLIFWGPPGSGKTTLASVIANRTKSAFVAFNAVLGGVAELREIVKQAEERRSYQGQSTILFVDEIHRFNKSQQDAFLPHVERGTVTLIGATTENPSFSVNAAVLSRCKVFRLEPLGEDEVMALLRRALGDRQSGLGERELSVSDETLRLMARTAEGDARRALNLLETAVGVLDADTKELDSETVVRAAGDRTLLYDKAGEEHYNVTSALIKSLRGSDPDAAIYYTMRMLKAGDDPLFILRRLIIFASEDVGNADPRALAVAVNADAAFRRLGMPEGIYPLAQACLYLASCPKSNAVKNAWQAADKAVMEHGALPVPAKLRNAVTRLMREHGYGEGYKYPHDFADNFVAGESYLPDELDGERFYTPSAQGLEQAIGERLERLRGKVRKPE